MKQLHSCLVVWVVLVSAAAAAAAEAPLLDRNHHVWARFTPGAWRDVEVVTTTYEETKQLRSTTSSLVFLESVLADGYRLQVDVAMTIGDKSFSTPTQFVSQALFAETTGKCESFEELPFQDNEEPDPGMSELDPRELEIAGKMIPVKRYRIVVQGDTSREVTKLFYAAEHAPHVLRKQTILWDTAGDQMIYSQVQRLTDVGRRRTVLGRTMSTWTVVTDRRGNKGNTRTESRYASEVPGGILSQSSEEWSSNKKLIRSTQLRLVDYGLRAQRSRRFGRGFIRPLDRFRRRKLMGAPTEPTEEQIQAADRGPMPPAVGPPGAASPG